jgi:hypothetical protein
MMAIELANKLGVVETVMANKPVNNSAILLDWIRTEFSLPAEMAAKCEEHFLRVWDGPYVVLNAREGCFTAPNLEHAYIVHWQSTPEVCRAAKKVGCSFRSYQGKHYVVIKVWKEQE